MTELAFRNHRCRPGDEFRDAIDLPGWDEQSVWGYDEGTSSFFAQLWTNGSSSDAPEIWLSGVTVTYPWPGSIALEIAERTRADQFEIIRALGLADPNPKTRSTDEITRKVVSVAMAADHTPDPYILGQRLALDWVAGNGTTCPGSLRSWPADQAPTPAQIDAEHHYVTGRIYRRQDQDAYSGADEALWWVLGR
jgi:hypothetical protein